MNRNFSLGLAVILIFGGIGCSNTKDLKKQFAQNPEIFLNVIEEEPSRFIEALDKAQMKAKIERKREAEAAEMAQLQENLKTPQPPNITATHPVRGDGKAPILFVTYGNFQCPASRRAFFTVEELRKKYGEKLAFVFKNYPLSMHPYSRTAALRYSALALQGGEKAFRYHDYVYQNQERLVKEGEPFLDEAAKKSGANIAKMKADMETKAVKRQVDDDKAEGESFGIEGTPGFVIGGIVVSGNQPLSKFEKIIALRFPDLRLAQNE